MFLCDNRFWLLGLYRSQMVSVVYIKQNVESMIVIYGTKTSKTIFKLVSRICGGFPCSS